MDIISWIKHRRSGNFDIEEDKVEIDHESGEHSTLWKNLKKNVPPILKSLGTVYIDFDGIDLFSSTFKIASLIEPKYKSGVKLIPTLKELEEELNLLNPSFPEETIPFMIQAGMGFYAIGLETGKIYEWDSEENCLSDEFSALDEIFEEWIEAIM